MKIKNTLSRNLLYLLLSFFIGMVIFSLFRTFMYVIYADRLTLIENASDFVRQSMLMGLRFDVVISCYIMTLPLLLVILSEYVKRLSPFLMRFVRIFVTVTYCIAFAMCLVDIPFFEQFNLRLNNVALTWISDSPKIVFGMIFTEISYFIYFVMFIALMVGYLFLQRFIWRKVNTLSLQPNKIYMIFVYLLMVCLLVIGFRGRFGKSPIRVGAAYFSTHSFINQMSLNPIFMFMRTLLDEKKNDAIKLMDPAKAIDYVAKEFNCGRDLKRIVKSPETLKKMNVVVILLESMSSVYIKSDSALVPNLKNLRDKSLYFPNIYSGGIHTFNGVYSTLFSFPGYMQHHTMKKSIVHNLGSFTSEFKNADYQTMFFVPNDEQFDNMGGFLAYNDIEKIIAQKDFNSRDVKTTLGVPDHVMFEKAIDELGKSYKEGKPFISFLLTASNHAPYYLPKDIDFKPIEQNSRLCMVEYSDWALQDFLDKASTQEWFDNTLFVITGDHGKSADGKYNISLTYNNIPLLFYAPGFIQPAVDDRYGCQMDIVPTVAGLLKMSYVNRTFGIDLVREKRPYAYFAADHKVAAIDQNWLYLYDELSGEYLYKLSENSSDNYMKEYPKVADSMRTYVFSMTQAASDKSKTKM